MSQSSTNASSTNANNPSTPQSQNVPLSGFANFTNQTNPVLPTQIPQFSQQQQQQILQNLYSQQQQQLANPFSSDLFSQLFLQQQFLQPQFQPQQIPEFSQPPQQTEIVEETQQPEAGPSQPRKKKVSKKVPWRTDEEELLAKTWIHISEDSQVANNQVDKQFWNRIVSTYNERAAELGLVQRNKDQLTSKFTAMSAHVKTFIGHYAEAERLRSSGSDDESVKDAAHQMYKNAEAAVFKYEKVWLVLRDKSRWRNFAKIEDPMTTVNLDDVEIPDDIFADDPTARPLGKTRSGKRKEPSSGSETAQSQSSSLCAAILDQFKKITRTKKSVAKEKKQTQYVLQRKEDLAFLQTSTEGMTELDAQWVESEKVRIRKKYGIIP